MKRTIRRYGAAFVTLALLVTLLLPAGVQAAGIAPAVAGEELQMAQVVMTSYSLENTEEPTAYTLRITLSNQGGANANNVLLTFQDERGVFLPAYGTANQLYIASIPAQSSVEQEIPLATEGTVEAFTMSFVLEYYNPVSSVRNAFSIGSFTGRPVDAVQLLQVELDGATDAEGNTPVRVAALNRSAHDVRDLTLNVYSPQSDTTQSVLLGELGAGATLDSTYPLQLNDGRIQQVRVSLSYQDGDGTAYTTAESLFTLYGYEAAGGEGTAAVTGFLDNLRPYLSEIALHLMLIGAVLLGLIAIWVRRRRRKKRGESL